MADLNELDRSGAVKIAGSDSTGLENNFANVDANGSLYAVLRNASGNALDVNFGAIGATTLRVAAILSNATGAADFNYGTAGAQTIRTASHIGNSTGPAAFGAGITSAQVLRVVLPTDQTSIPAKVQDGAGNAINSNNNQLQVRDVINTSGQSRAQSITTTVAEALGATTILVNRKFISITPTNGIVYWGFSNAVTTLTGTPIFKNQTITIATTDNVHIYLIAGATTDCRIAEGS